MPIDASLFMQFAQQRDAQNQALANSLNDMANQMGAVRLRREETAAEKDAKGLNIDSLANQAAYKSFMGMPLTPDDQAALQVKSLFEGQKTTYEPDANGAIRAVSQPTIWDRFQSMQGGMRYQGRFPPIGQSQPSQVGIPQADMMPMPQVSIADLIAPVERVPLAPPSALTPQQAAALEARGNPFVGEAAPLPTAQQPIRKITAPQLPYGATNTDVKAAEADIGLQKTSAEADISAPTKQAEGYATKSGQLAAENEAKLPAIEGFIQELESFGVENVAKLPSGALESGAATVSNFFGYPTESAIAQADLDSRLPMLLGQAKQIVRQAGEGTFTDYDAKSLEKMIWKEADSERVKMQKYETILNAMKRAQQRIKGKTEEFTNQSKPGFKYLGIKK